ncbi:MAG: flippase-like domain-containing protein, partial [Deltaproteobacteria bacterium]|nr:flippase-like domain-containing protein [Deltaproteobacteria bacterium]
MESQPNHFGGARATKQLGKTVAKVMLGTVLLYYVLHSQMIDFRTLGPVLLSPRTLALSLSFLAFSALACAFRWYLLATAQGLAVSFRTMFELTMIGNFFNTFLPGSVGGDLIKAWYIANHASQNKTRAIFTVILDRIIGLAVIVFYSAFSLLFFTEILHGDHRLKVIGLSVWSFTLVSGVAGFVFFSPVLWKQKWFSDLVAKMEQVGRLGKVVQAAVLYRHRLGTIIKATFLSSFSALGITTLYILHGHTLGISLPLARYF